MSSERVSLSKAIELMKREGVALRQRLGSERLAVWQAHLRVLASDVYLERALPLQNIATMDGFALSSTSDFPLKICGSVYAGDTCPPPLKNGEAVRIATGAPLPCGADAILKMEDAIVRGTELTGPHVRKGDYVLAKGSDLKEGVVLRKGTVLDWRAMALASACTSLVEVVKAPKVGVLSSGEEIRKGTVPDTNAPMVCGLLRKFGAQALHLGVLPDEPRTCQTMLENVSDEVDVLITIGGASVGERDYVWRALDKTVFRGVCVRPGKPLTFGYMHETPIVCLPGKPIGAYTAMKLVVSHLFCTPSTTRCTASMGCSVDIPSDGFQYVLYGHLSNGTFTPIGVVDKRYSVSVVSAMLSGIMCDGYVLLDEPAHVVEEVEVFLM